MRSILAMQTTLISRHAQSPRQLFWQGELAINLEVAADTWRSGIRLSAANAHCVITCSDDRITILGHHTQIAALQLKVNLLVRARLQVNALKSAKSNLRRTLYGRKLEIDLYRLISRDLAGVGYRDISGDGLPCRHNLRRDTEVAVLKGGIAESVAKRIERLAFEVPVGPVCHLVVFEVGQLSLKR